MPKPRPEEAFTEARKAVANYRFRKLAQIDTAGFDPLTIWYLLAWDAFRAREFPFDDARQLALAIGGFNISELKGAMKLLEVKSGICKLLTPALRDYPWKIGYASDSHNPIVDFYIPALERASQYDRKAGFFNSAILSSVARGIGAMLTHQGKIRLIMGCQFSPQDITAIRQGYNLRDALTAPLDRALTPPQNISQLKHFELLSWLIEHNYLDLRIAIPLKSDGAPEDPSTQLAPERLFHEKVEIITDSYGDRLAFSGSNNESLGGWYANVESFHVYLDWGWLR